MCIRDNCLGYETVLKERWLFCGVSSIPGAKTIRKRRQAILNVVEHLNEVAEEGGRFVNKMTNLLSYSKSSFILKGTKNQKLQAFEEK